MRLLRPLAAASLALTLWTAGPARADPADREAADALFNAGRAAVAKGDYATACARFRDSDRLDPALGTKFNLADCEEHLGHVATAWALFTEVAPKFDPGDDRIPIAKERIAALEKRLPRLIVRLAPAAQGAAVERDGAKMDAASLGVAAPVDPGLHVITVTLPGEPPRKYDVDTKEGATQEITVGGDPAAAPTASASTSAGPGRVGSRVQRTVGLVVGGAGLVGIGIGLAAGAVALGHKATVEKHCKNDVCDDQDGIDAAKDGREAAGLSTVTFLAGAAALVTGVVLVVTTRGGARVAVAPAASPQSAGLVLTGSF